MASRLLQKKAKTKAKPRLKCKMERKETDMRKEPRRFRNERIFSRPILNYTLHSYLHNSPLKVKQMI